MARVQVSVDGDTIMDADLGRWTSKPPQILRDQLAANAAPKLYMRCLLVIVADAAMSATGTSIDITTYGDNWTMRVERE